MLEKQVLVDRRNFLQLISLASASAALGSASLGCSDYQIEIPCLGPASPPAAAPGVTYLWASKIGCVLDCDLHSGRSINSGKQATDDGPRINAALAGASATNPITLILDGVALVSGLFLPTGGYWSIAGLGCGTGIFIKSGTDNDGIHNGSSEWYRSDPGPPAPARGRSVSLSNFTINGNAGDGKTGVSNAGDIQGSLRTGRECYPINLMNLDDISIENVVIVNSPCYQIRLSNVGRASVSGCVLQGFGPNTDGIHIDGPANDISITQCSITANDDGIALNCPEGYSGGISRVSVGNCTFNSVTVMRLDTIEWPGDANRFYIEDVSISDCTGTLQMPCFDLGDGTGSNPSAVGSLTISDCTFKAPALLDIWANFGRIALRNVKLVPSGDVWKQPGYAFARTNLKLLNPCSGTYIGSSLSFENCSIERHGDVDVSALILQNDSTILNVSFTGFSVLNASGHQSKTRELINLISGTLGQLVINAIDVSNIANPINNISGFSNISVVSGAGVLATGWEFPDSVMANGVPYISASSHRPSIRVGGVVEPYP